MSTTLLLALLVSTLQRARGQAASITVCVIVSASRHQRVLCATVGMRGTSRNRSTSVNRTRPRPQWTGGWQSRSRIQESLPPAPPTWGALYATKYASQLEHQLAAVHPHLCQCNHGETARNAHAPARANEHTNTGTNAEKQVTVRTQRHPRAHTHKNIHTPVAGIADRGSGTWFLSLVASNLTYTWACIRVKFVD